MDSMQWRAAADFVLGRLFVGVLSLYQRDSMK